jgi:hypothetical protein
MSLHILDFNRYVQSESRLLVCDDGRADVASGSQMSGTYEIGSGTLVLNAEVGPGASYRSFASFGGDSLTIYRREARTDTGASSTDPTQLVFRATG